MFHCRWEPKFILWRRSQLLGGRAWEEDGVWQRSTLGLSFFLGLTEPMFPEILTSLLFSDDRIDKRLEGYRVSLPKFIPVLPSIQRAKKDKERRWGYGKDWELEFEDWGFFSLFFQWLPFSLLEKWRLTKTYLAERFTETMFCLKKVFANSTACEWLSY